MNCSLRSPPNWHRGRVLRPRPSVFLWGIAFALFGCPVAAQVVPDQSLGREQSIVVPSVPLGGLPASRVDGGAARGANLFHSFAQFNIGQGERVFFANPISISNIITRVTGGGRSSIAGTLGVNGSANLFLINPQGILFAPTAQLALRGSFFASTAQSVVFADGTQFSATSPQAPLLTVSAPVGLQLGQSPAPIQVQGARLVIPGRTLGLVGGTIDLQGGTVAAPTGRVELGSGAGGVVSLAPTAIGWRLGYADVPDFREVLLSQGATVDVSGLQGGEVQVQGRSLQLRGGSRITALTLGTQAGGAVTITTSESVAIAGTGNYVQQVTGLVAGNVSPTELRNGIYTASLGFGAAGNVVITTPNFSASNGAFVVTTAFGAGQGGDLTLNTTQRVDLNASTLATGSSGAGDAGRLTVNTSQLTAQAGATLTTLSSRSGRAGDLSVNAMESVTLVGNDPVMVSPRLRFFTGLSSSTLGTGAAGDLQVTTRQLSVRDGATIAAITAGAGQAGNLRIRASDSVEVSGRSPDGMALSSVANGTEVGSTGRGGNLTVETGRLLLQDQGRLSVRSRGVGEAGNITVRAGSIRLSENASIAAAAVSGQGGGSVFLQANDLQVRGDSVISTEAGGRGNGGNIAIDTRIALVAEDSRISANAFEGVGGNVAIETQGLIRNSTSLITASSTLGINGTVDINTALTDVQTALTELPQGFANSDQVLADSCLSRQRTAQGSFTITGNGGLPPTPYGSLAADYPVASLQAIGSSSRSSKPAVDRSAPVRSASIDASINQTAPIQEAQGWVVTADGQVILGTTPQLVAS
ncbi:MAG TPA: filamentous hemagglutinin N-terminal domain-containing protein, partial [Thermosynechococcaceae cyanobacterium]